METIKTFKEFKKSWENAEVVDYKNPTCKSCNDCCSTFAFITPEEYNRLNDFLTFDKLGRDIALEGKVLFTNLINNGTFTCMCLFSDFETKKCKIYDIRPKICKEFHCSPELNKSNRDNLGRTEFRLIGELFVPDMMKRFAKLMIEMEEK